MNHISPIIHMTDQCNMACKYCYTGPTRRKPSDISRLNGHFHAKLPVLFKFVDQVMDYNQFANTIFSFHGGEPLLIDLENWSRILTYFREKSYPIESHIQTNGTLINDDLIGLFNKFDVKVGISLDGPIEMNNQTRLFKNGQGSFQRVYKNLDKLRNAGLGFGCLVTLNGTNIGNVKEIYAFFKQEKIPFNVRVVFDTRYSVPKELLVTPDEYAKAVIKLFDLWFDETETEAVQIGDFTSMVARYIKPLPGLTTCTFTEDCCKRFVSFDMEGNLWHCARLYGDTNFLYGNIQKTNLVTLLSGDKMRHFSLRWEKLAETECRDCAVSQYCYGGCPALGYIYFGSYFRKDYFCAARRLILEHIYKRMGSLLGHELD